MTDPGASTSSSDPGTSISTRSRNSSHSSAAAAHSGTSENNTTINSNVCCVCYICTFEEDQLDGNGLEWVQCVCGRWLHEECICDIDVDDQGRELFCPFCAV